MALCSIACHSFCLSYWLISQQSVYVLQYSTCSVTMRWSLASQWHTWVGVGHVWQARLMRWLLIIIEMLINKQMIYNHHTVTKQWGSNILDFELLVKAWNIAWRFTFHATLFWTEHSLLSHMLDTLISPFCSGRTFIMNFYYFNELFQL